MAMTTCQEEWKESWKAGGRQGEEVARGGRGRGAIRAGSCHPWMTFSLLPSVFHELCPPRPQPLGREGFLDHASGPSQVPGAIGLIGSTHQTSAMRITGLIGGRWQVWAGFLVSSLLTSTLVGSWGGWHPNGK